MGPSDVIDLEFRVTILEKILQRLLGNAVVSAGLTETVVRELWDETLTEIQARHPFHKLKLRPPEASLTQPVLGGEASRQTKYTDVWRCPECKWQGIAVSTTIPRGLADLSAKSITLACPSCAAHVHFGSPRGETLISVEIKDVRAQIAGQKEALGRMKVATETWGVPSVPSEPEE